MTKIIKFIKKNWFEIIFICFALAFSWWLMWQTFYYKDDTLYIASKAWSDFAANIPLIRSFSFGNNFPPEYPLFPGEPIRYHFLFYLLVGFLEKIGLPLDWALNIPSVLSFFFLLTAIYFLAKYIFKNSTVAIFSVIFFLFNGSLSFIEFFKQHPLSFSTIKDIISNNAFPAFFPYNSSSLIAGGFWNLNIFTNQRHFSSALALLLFSFLFIFRKIQNNNLKITTCLLTGFVLGTLPFWNGAVFIMAVAVFGSYLLLSLPHRNHFLRLSFLLATLLLLSLPQIFLLRGHSLSLNLFNPGYLIFDQLSLSVFIKFWFLNLGLNFFLIPLGFIFSNRNQKKIFICFFSLFIIGNLFQFSPEIAANHKFFNLFLIVGNMYSAFLLFSLWQKNFLGKIISPILIFFLIFSGIIDLFPIINDDMYAITDAPLNRDVLWIEENTPVNSVILNSSFIYDPASLAGRKIFLGWPYFAWSAGYDTNQRSKIMKQIYESNQLSTTCYLLKQNNINFIETTLNVSHKEFEINYTFFKENFVLVYQNKTSDLIIYDVLKSCQK